MRLERLRPTHLVSELRVKQQSLLSFLPDLMPWVPLSSVFVATLYPSVATAVRLVRMGIGGYYSKPLSILALSDMFGDLSLSPGPRTADDEATWPTLDRTIWEYLSQVYAAVGTISAAARHLGVDRRSLRRMLAKYPPPA